MFTYLSRGEGDHEGSPRCKLPLKQKRRLLCPGIPPMNYGWKVGESPGETGCWKFLPSGSGNGLLGKRASEPMRWSLYKAPGFSFEERQGEPSTTRSRRASSLRPFVA